jgi:hypothetical protein
MILNVDIKKQSSLYIANNSKLFKLNMKIIKIIKLFINQDIKNIYKINKIIEKITLIT